VTNPIRRLAARSEGAPADRNRARWIWAAAYALVTTLCFSPTLTLPSSPVRAGAIATRDFVAPRDLIVPDLSATARRPADAAAEVLPVYDWDPTAASRLENELADSFRKAREAVAARRRGGSLAAVRESFGLPVGEEAFAALARLSFSREVEDRLTSAATDLYR